MDERTARVRDVRRRLVQDGPAWTRPHERDFETVTLPERDCDLLRDLFVDGSHRFHEVFVDLYYLRKIVRPGGLIVMDDDWTPSVRTAVRYCEHNLGWTAIPDAFAAGTPRNISDDPTAEAVPRCRALRLPDSSVEPPFDQFQLAVS